MQADAEDHVDLIEDYCRLCGDLFDPWFGCRCSLLRGTPLPNRGSDSVEVQGRLPLQVSPIDAHILWRDRALFEATLRQHSSASGENFCWDPSGR